MIKGIDLAKKIKIDSEHNWSEELDDLNLYKTFRPVYHLDTTMKNKNLLVSFIIYSYDPDSPKLDIKKDRYDNKLSIMDNLGIDAADELMVEVINNSNDTFNEAVANYLDTLTTWRWQSIYALLDYHSSMIRFANQKTETEKSIDKVIGKGEQQSIRTLTTEFDIDVISKVNKQKGELLEQALKARLEADKLLDEIRKEFMPTDHATQSDFGSNFTETAKKKVNIESWSEFIKNRNDKLH